MLNAKDALATIAVKDIAVARKFYQDTLGLTPLEGNETDVSSYRTGNTTILVYKSQFAGTNRATAVTWTVGPEVDEIVRALSQKGVVFEKYDMPDTKHEGQVHVSGKMRVAWFKDPDGNILAIVNQ